MSFLQKKTLRLFQPDDSGGEELSGLSPRMTLSQFFEQWYVPIVQRGKRKGTIDRYRDTIKWWKRITKDPAIEDISDLTLADFDEGLNLATYKKGKYAKNELALERKTIELHLRNLRAVLFRAGPKADPKRPTARLVEEVPYRPFEITKAKRKLPFDWGDVRRMMGALDWMQRPRVPYVSPAAWWRGFLGFLFCTGLRPGTVWQLEWPMLVEKKDGWWLDVPARIVTKEYKAIELAVPQWAVDTISTWPQRSTRIFACGVKAGRVRDWHAMLQRRAQVTKVQSPRAWRRTHDEVIKRLGLANVQDLMRKALDHGDFKTTSESYSADPIDDFRRMLPCPWEGVVPDRQKQMF